MSIAQPLLGMSIAQPLLGVDVEEPPVDFESDDFAGDVVLDVSVVFFESPPELAVSPAVEVLPEPASELDDSLFADEPVFDDPRLSVL
jgi:hypothetical protein